MPSRLLAVFFTGRGWFDRASILRHFALCLAVVLAYVLRFQLRTGHEVLAIIGVAAGLNLLSYLLADRPRVGSLFRVLSPVFGVAGWTALIHLTGGVQSPFIAGFGLEVLLAARTFGAVGIAWVGSAAVVALWLQQGLIGLGGQLPALVVQTTVLTGIGVVAFFLTRHWTRVHDDLSERATLLRGRLRRLEQEFETLRASGEVGEHVERLAHGLKNAVHSLSGFAGIVERGLRRDPKTLDAFEGLGLAIRQLEELWRLTLGPPDASPRTPCEPAELSRTLDDALLEASREYPRMRWRRIDSGPMPEVRVPPATLREVLNELFRNAADATKGCGGVTLETHRDANQLRIRVRDNGPGIPPHERGHVFRRGFTTKPDGHGLGLFLARHLLESHGGRLSAESHAPGTSICIRLPLDPDASCGARGAGR